MSSAIAAKLACPVLHLMVHDSDVFIYTLHDGGVAVDEYWSRPDYFKEVTPKRRQETEGRPELLAALTGADSREIAAVLARTGQDERGAEERLTQLAKLLGITNADSSYEYLQQCETEGVSKWKKFVHVPDLATEKEAARRLRTELKALTKRLERAGVLVATRKPSSVFSLVCAHPLGGFLIGSPPGRTDGPVIEWWQAPWEKLTECFVPVTAYPHKLVVSSTGRFLAVASNAGRRWFVELFDLRERSVLAVVELSRSPSDLSFAPDERTLVCRVEGKVTLTETSAPFTSRTLSPGVGTAAAVHPAARWLVASINEKESAGLALVDLSGRNPKHVLRGPKHDLTAFLERMASSEPWTAGNPYQVRKLRFLPDGHLVVVIEPGVRVYSWDAVLTAQGSIPQPVFSGDTDFVSWKRGSQKGWSQMTYDYVVDERRHRILFCGLGGRVHELSLETGRATPLLEVPGASSLTRLALDASGMNLATAGEFGARDGTGKDPVPFLQVWNVSSLPYETFTERPVH